MATIFKIRRDTSANWSSNNPTLADGELGLDKTNTYLKIGDGSTAWNSLGQFTQTEEQVEDYIGGMVTGNTETFITVTYEDGDVSNVDCNENLFFRTPNAYSDISLRKYSSAFTNSVIRPKPANGSINRLMFFGK